MEQARQRRIKLVGTAAVVDGNPELFTQLAVPGYDAVVERAVLVTDMTDPYRMAALPRAVPGTCIDPSTLRVTSSEV